ncbi:MAG: four helix bundle protein [Bacteroidetes bacterium]|nr:four helix bundle protein [Bacteroidota bacterium]
MGNYKELEVWQESRNLAVEIYNATNSGLFKKDFSFRDQIRRAAISIPSNIAEGDESGFNKLGIRYFYNAKASLAEVETQLNIASKTSYISEEDYKQLSASIIIISKKLSRLIKYRLSK